MGPKATGKRSVPTPWPGKTMGIPHAARAPQRSTLFYFLAGASSAAVLGPLGGLAAVVAGEWAPAASSGLASGAT